MMESGNPSLRNYGKFFTTYLFSDVKKLHVFNNKIIYSLLPYSVNLLLGVKGRGDV